jgi:hypothetical protein
MVLSRGLCVAIPRLCVCGAFSYVWAGNKPYLKRSGVEVVGMDQLWLIALTSTSRAVGAAVTSFLVTIHSRCVLPALPCMNVAFMPTRQRNPQRAP